jgi:anti-anti-sigma regulatory factor
MTTATSQVWFEIDGESVVPTLQEARTKLDGADGGMVLGFSTVRRIDPSALRALEELARAADHKDVKVVLRGVNIGIYKVLKLSNLTSRFDFQD